MSQTLESDSQVYFRNLNNYFFSKAETGGGSCQQRIVLNWNISTYIFYWNKWNHILEIRVSFHVFDKTE
jgi:hypothetical protein